MPLSLGTTAERWEQLGYRTSLWIEGSWDPLLQLKFTQVLLIPIITKTQSNPLLCHSGLLMKQWKDGPQQNHHFLFKVVKYRILFYRSFRNMEHKKICVTQFSISQTQVCASQLHFLSLLKSFLKPLHPEMNKCYSINTHSPNPRCAGEHPKTKDHFKHV